MHESMSACLAAFWRVALCTWAQTVSSDGMALGTYGDLIGSRLSDVSD
jgi:hypothetical protein